MTGNHRLALLAALLAAALAASARPALAHPPIDHPADQPPDRSSAERPPRTPIDHDDLRDPAVTSEDSGSPRGEGPALFGRELADPTTLGVGRVARDVAHHLPEVQALADYLSPRVRDLGYQRALPVLARDLAEMVDFLRRGIVDVVSDAALAAIHLERAADATVLLLERREGRDTATSVLFTASDSPVHSLGDLRGRRVALERSASPTAPGLPLLALREAGLATAPLRSAGDAVPAGTVGWFFPRGESTTASLVMQKSADAGAMDGLEWKRLQAEQVQPALRALHETTPVPRAFLLVGPSVPEAAREGLRRQLLAMSDDAAGREVLDRYHRIDRFAPVDAALAARLRELGPVWETLRAEIEP